MTDISNELQAWRNAKKGKDVREAQILLSKKLNEGKLEKNLGPENKGKVLKISENGDVVPENPGSTDGGENGITPHIGENGNWYLGEADTGVKASGSDGVTPHIGDNGNWYLGETDTGVKAEAPSIDSTLTESGKAADAKITGEKISELKSEIDQLKQAGTGSGSGATVAQANSLWVVLQKAAFAEVLTDEELNTFKTTWGVTTEIIPATGVTLDKSTLSFSNSATQTLMATVEPSNCTDKITWESSDTGIATVSNGVVTPVSNGSCTITAKAGSFYANCEVTVSIEEVITLSGISATYTGGDVAVGTMLDELTGITVTATYSDGSMENVTDYSLSGAIAEGSNTITVYYGGKTTTFTVIGYKEGGIESIGTFVLGTASASTSSSLSSSDTVMTIIETAELNVGDTIGFDDNSYYLNTVPKWSYALGLKSSAGWIKNSNGNVYHTGNYTIETGGKYLIMMTQNGSSLSLTGDNAYLVDEVNEHFGKL